MVSCGAACGLGKGGAWARQALNFCISCYLGCCLVGMPLFDIDTRVLFVLGKS